MNLLSRQIKIYQMNIRTSQKDYLPEYFDKEVAADIGESILMANDQALKYALSKFHQFDDISNYFIMSKSTLNENYAILRIQ